MKKILAITFIIIVFILAFLHASTQTLSFTGATGFGKITRGAYGKTGVMPVVLYVDNLLNTGTGSLRDALAVTTPRIIIFRIGGTITLTSTLTISSPYVTIAGYTAPGGGICIRGAAIVIQTDNIIIRNIRIRNGVYLPPDAGTDNISISAGGNIVDSIMIDHCSVSWASDEQIGINGSNSGVRNLTFQNSILAEGFIDHGFGLLVGGSEGGTYKVQNMSVHKNLFISCPGRMPRVSPETNSTVINNLAHNWIAKASEYTENTTGDVMYNKFKSGTNTTGSGLNKAIQIRWDGIQPKSTIYFTGNVSNGAQVIAPFEAGADDDLATTPHYNNTIYGFTPQTNTTILESELLPTVGPFPRDAVDTRLVSEYTNSTGVIPAINASFTYPTLAAGTYPTHNNGVHLSWIVSKGYAANEAAAAALTSSYLIDPVNGNTDYSITEEFINDPDLYAPTTTMSGNYYFSSVSGDDSRTAIQAQNQATPWRTLSKLNSFWASGALNPGEKLLLKGGETFYGSVIPGESGSSVAPIIVTSYGTGQATVTGFTNISGWTNLGSGIWESATTTALLPFLNMVIIDGVQYGMGRYPDSDAADGGYLRFESFVGTTSITDNQLTTTPYNWTGAEVVIKPFHWVINRANITSHGGGTLGFVGDQQPIGNNYGYFIQNDARTLTKYGEWYHNKATEKIRVYFGSELPTNHIIEAATIDSLLYISSKSYIDITNITFRGANGNAIRTIGSGQTAIHIDSCTVQFAGIDGIIIGTSLTGFRLTNSNIFDCNNSGVMATQTVNAYIADNSIGNTYMIPGMGGERDGMGYGIRVGAGGIVEYNSVVNSGNNGIYFSGANTIIRYNFIDSFCIVKDDGGGINSGLTGGYVSYTGRALRNNIILHGRGNNDGTPSTEFAAHGIYLDDNLNGVEVMGNTVAEGRGAGSLFHNNRDVIIRQNTFYNNPHAQINVLDDPNHSETSGLRIASNIMATTNETQSTMILEDNLDDIGGFGSLDSNVYANLLSSNTSIILSRNNLATLEYHNLASWRLRYGDDANGAYSQKNVAPYSNLVLVGTNKIPSPLNNSTFSNAGEAWSGISVYSGTPGVMDGGFLAVTPNATTITGVAINVGNVVSGTPYILRFSVKGNVTYDDQSSFGVRVRGTTNTPFQYHKVLTTREEVEMLFVPQFSGSATLEYYLSEGGTVFYLDNIIFNQTTATITDYRDSIIFEYNATKVNKVVPLEGTWKDVYGTSYSTNVTIEPYESKILIFNTDSTSPAIETPVLSWPPITRIFAGTPLSDDQLNASANIDGTWVYCIPAGTILPIGTHILTATFIPTDTDNYNTVTISNTIEVYAIVPTPDLLNFYITNGRTIYIKL